MSDRFGAAALLARLDGVTQQSRKLARRLSNTTDIKARFLDLDRLDEDAMDRVLWSDVGSDAYRRLWFSPLASCLATNTGTRYWQQLEQDLGISNAHPADPT